MGTPKETIAVAADFGTTYSAVAFMKIDGSGNQVPTQLGEWPGLPDSKTSYKVPTIVVYTGGGEPVWGFEAEKLALTAPLGAKIATMFKPFLDPMFKPGQYPTPLTSSLEGMVHDYIQGLYIHLVNYLEKERISNDMTDLNFLLTVPANFGSGVVENFRRIIKGTGIGNHTFTVSLTEPEAAGLYAMQVMQEKKKSIDIKKGECFIVCDAGGATIDLSSYNVLQTNPIRVEHTSILSGKYCGSIFIDSAFRSYLNSLMGEGFWGGLAAAKQDSMIKAFTKEKERFNNNTNNDYINIELPPDDNTEYPGKKGPYLPISREQMQGFFTESLNGIRAMIETHIARCSDKGYRHIFLVGGLGSSPYTKDIIEEYFDTKNLGIKVFQPQQAQQAVVLGAISNHTRLFKKGVPDPVQVRICPKHYGLVTMKSKDTINNSNEGYLDPLSGLTVPFKDQITWFFQKGDRITSGPERYIEKHFLREFIDYRNGWEEIVVEYSGDNPPPRMDSGSEVSKICTLVPNLRNCPKSDFKKLRMKKTSFFSRRVKYYQARYTIKISLGTTGLGFEMLYKSKPRADLMSILWV